MQDILEFEKKYKGSDEEKQDVIQLYVQYEGDMDAISASTMCFSQDEEPRIRSIIQAAIDSGDVKAFTAFTQESEKKRKARRKRVRNVSVLKPKKFILVVISLQFCLISLQADREQQEAEEMRKEIGLDDKDDSLMMMLQVKHEHTCMQDDERFLRLVFCLSPP